jgi:hypothetical protein
MSWAVVRGTALTPLALAPSKPHASAWSGKVQAFQPNGQQVRASRGRAER